MSRVLHREMLVDAARVSAAYLSDSSESIGGSLASLDGSIVTRSGIFPPSSVSFTLSTEVQVASLRGANIDETIFSHL